jgi:kynurenine formamidase
MPLWPGDPPPEFEDWANIARNGYYLRRFTLSEHAGTHLTAPASFYPSSRTVDQYTPEELVKPAVVIDALQQCQADPDYALTPGDVAAWESRHGPIPADSIALLLTGWAERWPNPAAYLGADANGGLHFPGFGPDAAALLLNERNAAGLGADTAGVEPGNDGSFTVSKLVLSQPRIVLENLANLHQLPPTGTLLVIGLLRLTGGSGSPAAVTAFVP